MPFAIHAENLAKICNDLSWRYSKTGHPAMLRAVSRRRRARHQATGEINTVLQSSSKETPSRHRYHRHAQQHARARGAVWASPTTKGFDQKRATVGRWRATSFYSQPPRSLLAASTRPARNISHAHLHRNSTHAAPVHISSTRGRNCSKSLGIVVIVLRCDRPRLANAGAIVHCCHGRHRRHHPRRCSGCHRRRRRGCPCRGCPWRGPCCGRGSGRPARRYGSSLRRWRRRRSRGRRGCCVNCLRRRWRRHGCSGGRRRRVCAATARCSIGGVGPAATWHHAITR